MEHSSPSRTADGPFTLLVTVVMAGVVLQIVNQLVSAYGTQVQVDTGQRMVYDLRRRLFEHLTALSLSHHITTSTADAVYRVDVDAYAIENLVMSGVIPLATSAGDGADGRSASCCDSIVHDRAALARGRALPLSVFALLHLHGVEP